MEICGRIEGETATENGYILFFIFISFSLFWICYILFFIFLFLPHYVFLSILVLTYLLAKTTVTSLYKK